MRRMWCLVLIALFIAFSGCAQAGGSRLLIDDGHGEIFTSFTGQEMGLDVLVEVFKEQGYETAYQKAPLDKKSLKGVNVLLIPGPMREFSDEERRAVKGFVEDGGVVIVIVHVPMPLEDMLSDYGIGLGWVVAETENVIDSPHDFLVTGLPDEGVLKGVEGLSFYGAFSVRAPETFVTTSSGSWEDLNMNGLHDDGEPTGPYAMVGVSKAGSGQVWVIGDDAPFINSFITDAGNKRLAENLAEIGRG